MAELSEKCRAAYHEAGHLFLAYNFRPSGILWARIVQQVGSERWDGDCRITLSDAPDESKAIVAVAGALAEARAAALARYEPQSTELRLDDDLVSQLSNFLAGDALAGQLDVQIHPAVGKIETSISINDVRWIAATQRNAESLRCALQDACDVCNDRGGWKVIRKLAKLIRRASPDRVYNVRMRSKIDDTLKKL